MRLTDVPAEKRRRGRPTMPPTKTTGFRLPESLLAELADAAASESRRLGYNVYVNGLVVRACREVVERCKNDDINTVVNRINMDIPAGLPETTEPESEPAAPAPALSAYDRMMRGL